jgi:hypothetical protein
MLEMRRIRTVVCVCVTLASGMLASHAAAQVHVGVGFGHGHGHGHHHHHGYHGWHGYGGWYDYGWYPPYYGYRPYVDYVYVTPPPVPVTYVQPSNPVAMQSSVTSAAAPAPSPSPGPTIAQPNVRRNALPGTEDRRVVIRNSIHSKTNVYFVVNGTNEYELAPGQTKILNDGVPCSVEFDRGGDFGTLAQEMRTGTYEFVVTDEGWSLQRTGSDTPETASRVVKKNVLPQTFRND